MNLNKNQLHAIQTSISNDFESGIHFHATGTGKSWIGLELILAFYKKYNESNKIPNIFWICERKSILIEQFSTKLLKERGFNNKTIEKFKRNAYGMKDFNSSDIVIKKGAKFYGVSLKKKDRSTSADPTLLNKSVSNLFTSKDLIII